jgi:hypothetical protein
MSRYIIASAIGMLPVIVACSRAAHPTEPSRTPIPVQTAAAPAAIDVLSGNGQSAKAGEHLPEPFAVRVTDRRGLELKDVLVSFRVASGAGLFDTRCDVSRLGRPATVRTDANGVGRAMFYPSTLGLTTVTAHVDGLDRSVTFAIDATIFVVDFWFGYWYAGFAGPCSNTNSVTVPVGTVVEWKAGLPIEGDPLMYTVTSTSTPIGGANFDSGFLMQSERFRFVPEVRGTWQYRDQVTGLTGTLRAQ